ncbi:MAG: phosphotransferase, partial [Hyphomonadaceae bacterium]
MSAELRLAGKLAAQAGLPAPAALARVEGGKNNRVFRLDFADGRRAAFKLYHADPRDPRDRLGAEWAFLSYAWARGVRACPEPLAQDLAAHAGLYAWLPGEKLSADTVRQAHVDAALDFVLAVNATPREIADLPAGSEACFSLAEHLATIDRRVARLAALDPQAPRRDEAAAFVAKHLAPVWEAVRARIARAGALDARIAPEATCLSPSDFGLHNALYDGERLRFLDFEYAGRDDPAKLASDFFCCPEIPTPMQHHARFVAGLVAGLGLSEADSERCALLLDA